jgi:tryptophan-rich sensory protein
MKQPRSLIVLCLVSLMIAIGSAIIASNLQVTDADLRPDWDTFGRSMWLTVLVTIPAFIIFAATAMASAVVWLKRNH